MRSPARANSAKQSIRLLLAARLIRSTWQGALVADFALYLQRLHWQGGSIGMLFAASFVIGAFLSLLVGPLSDRCGYQALLVGYEFVVALLFGLAAYCTDPWTIAIAAVLGGFGRGANGAPGCFVPAELAWLAALLPPPRRAEVFSLNAAVGFIGMTIGGMLAIGPDLWAHWLHGASAFRPLFVVGGTLSIANACLLLVAPAGSRQGISGECAVAPIVARQGGVLFKVTAINLCNGLSVGLSGPLIAFWFATKFHVGPVQIGPIMMAGFLSAALSAAAISRLALRATAASIYVRMQWMSLLLLLLLPLLPTFSLAAAAWVVKFALERGAGGTMEAVNVGLAGPGRWGMASGLSVASLALPRSVGPALTGHWIATGSFTAPLVMAGVLQAAYLVLYGRAIGPRGAGA